MADLQRPSTLFAALVLLICLATALLAAHHRSVNTAEREDWNERTGHNAATVRRLMLTDLCVFTSASYLRHPSQSDLFAPFQNHPGLPDAFPSGMAVMPYPSEER